MEDVAIKVENLCKIYKLYEKPIDRLKESLHPLKKKCHSDFYALNNISFSVKKGETVGIIGKNGSGKSTLLKIITGVLTQNSGNIEINGRVSALLELGAGFNPEFTGIENIYLNGTLMGYSHEEMGNRIPAIIEFADIGEFIHQPVKIYSSGMFIRLAFAVAINVDPDILIIDEALAVGDLRFQLKCMDKFDEFRQQGKTIIFVSHDINSVKRFCSRSIWINEGMISYIGDTDICTDRYTDYLKIQDHQSNSKENKLDKENITTLYNNIEPKNQIAEILDIKLLNCNYDEIESIDYGQHIIVEVTYVVSNLLIDKPVLGVAIYGINNEYVCGLNTLLDKHAISWNKGINKCYLHYNKFNLIGGSYYFDTAIFEKNATVAIDYKTRYKEFFVKAPYVGEGIVILSHEWSSNER